MTKLQYRDLAKIFYNDTLETNYPYITNGLSFLYDINCITDTLLNIYIYTLTNIHIYIHVDCKIGISPYKHPYEDI